MSVTEHRHHLSTRVGDAFAARPSRGAVPQRVLFFGKSMTRSRCSGALVDAIEQNGARVRWVKFARNRRFLGTAGAERRARRIFWGFRPDLVFVLSRDLPIGLLDEFRTHVAVVIWNEDLLPEIDENVAALFGRADLVSVSDPSRSDALRESGVDNVIHQMSGFSPRYHRPWPVVRPRRDCVFVGGPGRHHQRAEFLAQVAEHFDVDVFGAGWKDVGPLPSRMRLHRPIGPRRYRRVCAESRIVLGMNESNSTPGYFSNRTWLTLACRGFHLTHYVPGLEEVFTPGRHLDWFRDVTQAIDGIGHYLELPAERRRIAGAGHALALARHQYRHRVASIFAALDSSLTAELR